MSELEDDPAIEMPDWLGRDYGLEYASRVRLLYMQMIHGEVFVRVPGASADPHGVFDATH